MSSEKRKVSAAGSPTGKEEDMSTPYVYDYVVLGPMTGRCISQERIEDPLSNFEERFGKGKVAEVIEKHRGEVLGVYRPRQRLQNIRSALPDGYYELFRNNGKSA